MRSESDTQGYLAPVTVQTSKDVHLGRCVHHGPTYDVVSRLGQIGDNHRLHHPLHRSEAWSLGLTR